MEAIVQHPSYFVFGAVLVAAGIVQIAVRKWQGRYAHQQWKLFGLHRMAKSPEFWVAASIAVGLIWVVVGLGLIVASFVP